MRRSFLAVLIVAAAACVEVPPNIHAQFAGVGPDERSNYRPGRHGTAPPVEEKATPASVKGPEPTNGGASGVVLEGSPATTATTDGGLP